jgi:hypothetical protein
MPLSLFDAVHFLLNHWGQQPDQNATRYGQDRKDQEEDR